MPLYPDGRYPTRRKRALADDAPLPRDRRQKPFDRKCRELAARAAQVKLERMRRPRQRHEDVWHAASASRASSRSLWRCHTSASTRRAAAAWAACAAHVGQRARRLVGPARSPAAAEKLAHEDRRFQNVVVARVGVGEDHVGRRIQRDHAAHRGIARRVADGLGDLAAGERPRSTSRVASIAEFDCVAF